MTFRHLDRVVADADVDADLDASTDEEFQNGEPCHLDGDDQEAVSVVPSNSDEPDDLSTTPSQPTLDETSPRDLLPDSASGSRSTHTAKEENAKSLVAGKVKSAHGQPHVLETDFCFASLTHFLRKEVYRLKRDGYANISQGKGKTREDFTPNTAGFPLPFERPSSPWSHAPAPYYRVTPIRRSLRIARKENPDRFPLPLPTLHDTPQGSSSGLARAPADTLEIESARTTFEEYTKSQRHAVRNKARDTPTSPPRTKVRQTRASKNGSTSASGPALRLEHPVTVASAENHASDLDGNTPPELPLNNVPLGQSAWDASLPADILSAGSGNAIRTPPAPAAPELEYWNTPIQVEDHTNHCFKWNEIVPENIPHSVKTANTFFQSVARARKGSGSLKNPDEPHPDQFRTVREYREFHRRHPNGPPPSPNPQPAPSAVFTQDLSPAVQTPQEASVPPATSAAPATEQTEAKNISTSSPSKVRKRLNEKMPLLQYPRQWAPWCFILDVPIERPHPLSPPTTDPISIWAMGEDEWSSISAFLSTEDVKNLRLVCKSFARSLAPIQFRNVVVNFDRNLFDFQGTDWDSRIGLPPKKSIFTDYGYNFNQFGISFEYDFNGLLNAQPKVIEKEQEAWFGKFRWPTEQYPRFPELQALEDLVDHNRPLLKDCMKMVTNASELGLCIDSGHGWLEGPDISDMALFNKRNTKGSAIFGKTFKTEDVWTTFARNEFFKWSQQNTINEAMKYLLAKKNPNETDARDFRFLRAVEVRDIESFKRQREQYDYDPGCHTGGIGAGIDDDDAPVNGATLFLRPDLVERRRNEMRRARKDYRHVPQWPVIFNARNLAAEHGGHLQWIQRMTPDPKTFPLTPGTLTEAQAQWLMETAWAQRAFLSSFTTAIITNKDNFRGIHTLRIAKLSSGLLPSLEQYEFWKTLRGLRKLEIFVSPDWRQEYVIGDKSFTTSMLISPAKAARKFRELLDHHIAKLENLHSLSIGFVGGGEDAPGMFARNQNVLPAPIIENPNEWLLGPGKKKIPSISRFDHVRELRFKNCWFTPYMLQEFMKTSRDTSLHSLILDSVSMTTFHDADIDRPLTTKRDDLHCIHHAEKWAKEILPTGAAWAKTLDEITPGKSLLEHKYDAGLLKKEEEPMPLRPFRGHVEQIILNSCGYVKISAPRTRSSTYNQNSLVVHSEVPMDHGLAVRRGRLSASERDWIPATQEINMAHVRAPDRAALENPSTNNADRPAKIMLCKDNLLWLGTLTQCIHPIEKRVLEKAWGLKFGWNDDLRRWEAVEDGMFEGGTGRFSGVIKKDWASGVNELDGEA